MTDQVKPISRPWRRFLRFSVRGLLVLVLSIGAGLGWIVRQARVQRDAVAAITAARGTVKYDWEWRNGKSIPGGKPWAPRWLTDFIGVDFFGHVTDVSLPFSSTADEAIVQVGRLTRVQGLDLFRSSVSDAALVHLKGLTILSELSLGVTQVTDAGLVHLRGLTSLSELHLHKTKITDAGLVHLKGLTKLSTLWIGANDITDAGLAHLKGLTNLADLFAFDTDVTDAGIKQLRQALPSLIIDE